MDRKTKIGIFLKLSFFFIFLFFQQILISYLFIRQATLKEREDSLISTIERVKKDLINTNGKWNTDLYNADPNTPTPNSSNPFPLYIVTTDGFVIERSRPINGLLDTSDYNRLLSFQIPQTVNTPTNEIWRVLSKPIRKEGNTVGVIMVSYYNPKPELTKETDMKLKENIEKINTNITLFNNKINISRLDVRSIPYDISYEVVDRFNKVLLTNGRIPSFIDVSYVASEINAPERIVHDEVTNEPFLVISKTLTDSKGSIVGIVTDGISIINLQSVLKNFLIFSSTTGLILTIPLAFFGVYILRKDLLLLLGDLKNKSAHQKVMKIHFDKKNSMIVLDNKKIEIRYASNQYYLTETFFSNPKKRWERDELLIKLGETKITENTRKIYDAMLNINEKVGIKLILYKDKTYRINPVFLPYLYSL